MTNEPALTGLEPTLGGLLREEPDVVKREIAQLEAEHGCRVWRTREGALLPVNKIDKDHLRNIALFLVRRLAWLGADRRARALLFKEAFGNAPWYPGDDVIFEDVEPTTPEIEETVEWFQVITDELSRRRGKVKPLDVWVLRGFGRELVRLAEGVEEAVSR